MRGCVGHFLQLYSSGRSGDCKSCVTPHMLKPPGLPAMVCHELRRGLCRPVRVHMAAQCPCPAPHTRPALLTGHTHPGPRCCRRPSVCTPRRARCVCPWTRPTPGPLTPSPAPLPWRPCWRSWAAWRGRAAAPAPRQQQRQQQEAAPGRPRMWPRWAGQKRGGGGGCRVTAAVLARSKDIHLRMRRYV